jgi:metal-responsive CopG/Arc/MetJ family transcriptional regulator
MGRPKLMEEDKKIKLSITISRDLLDKINNLTKNKSVFIETLIKKYVK